jgi:uncharacterized protein (DUF427 family)
VHAGRPEKETSVTRQMLTPSSDHPITIEATGRRVVVRAGDQVIAESTHALTLMESTYPAVQYLPLTDVDESLLRKTDTTTYCPFKGEASYYTVVAPDGEISDAIWTYEQPYPAVSEIAEHVAFYPSKVQITVTDDVVSTRRT